VKTIPARFHILSLHSIIFLPWELSTGVKKNNNAKIYNAHIVTH